MEKRRGNKQTKKKRGKVKCVWRERAGNGRFLSAVASCWDRLVVEQIPDQRRWHRTRKKKEKKKPIPTLRASRPPSGDFTPGGQQTSATGSQPHTHTHTHGGLSGICKAGCPHLLTTQTRPQTNRYMMPGLKYGNSDEDLEARMEISYKIIR